MKLLSGWDRVFANFHDILDFAILSLILTITDSNLLISFKKNGVPYCAGHSKSKIAIPNHEI
jgi:hypothetical protein